MLESSLDDSQKVSDASASVVVPGQVGNGCVFDDLAHLKSDFGDNESVAKNAFDALDCIQKARDGDFSGE